MRRPATNVGPGVEADDADEHGEPDGVEDPERRLWNPAERRPDRSQPPEDQPHDERAATRSEAERQSADAAPTAARRTHRRGCRGRQRRRRSRSTGARCSREARPTRSTSAGLPARRSKSPRLTIVSALNGISSPPADQRLQHDAASVLCREVRQAAGRRTSCWSPRRPPDQRDVEQASSSTSSPSWRVARPRTLRRPATATTSPSHSAVVRIDGARWHRRGGAVRRIRVSGAKDARRPERLRPASATVVTRYARRSHSWWASRSTNSHLRPRHRGLECACLGVEVELSSRGARLDRNHTTKPVPTR